MYVVSADDKSLAEMHFIINGEDQGACTRDIPYNTRPLHAVVDVYGTTKEVKIVQLYGGKQKAFTILHDIYVKFTLFSVTSLQSACREAILQHLNSRAVNTLPLPEKLKKYLLYR